MEMDCFAAFIKLSLENILYGLGWRKEWDKIYWFQKQKL